MRTYSRVKAIEKKRKMRKRKMAYSVLGLVVMLGILLGPTIFTDNKLFSKDSSAEATGRSEMTIATHDAVSESVAEPVPEPTQADVPPISSAPASATAVAPKPAPPKEQTPVLPPTTAAGAVVTTTDFSDGSKVAFLTIDDGPSAYTGKLLDILSSYGVKASFFMLEPGMRKYPDAVVRMVNEGHMPAMHGVSHDKNVVYASAASVVGEMLQGQACIEELTGFKSHVFRSPYGSKPYMTDAYKAATAQAGLLLWDWNVDSLDWKYRSGKYVSHTIEQVKRLTAKNVNPVILIHDRKETIASLPKLLDYLIDNGYTFQITSNTMAPIQFK